MGTRLQQSIQYFTPESKPFGLTYGEWTVKWWKWAMSIPIANNPIVDDTGQHAHVFNNNPYVFFLAGTFGGATAQRKCRVNAYKAILFPVINYEVNPFEDPELKTKEELLTAVRRDMDDITNLETTIDGQNVPVYRIKSDPLLFDFKIALDTRGHMIKNMIGGPHDINSASSDGYWVFVKSLPKGEHDIFFAGSCSSGARNVRANYKMAVY